MANTELKRKRLFRKSKPIVRELKEEDVWVFWAAYKEGSFPDAPTDLNREGLAEWLKVLMGGCNSFLMIEDYNKMFKDKKGLVCLVMIKSDGLRIEPQFLFFKWATKMNILRCTVRFFNWIRYSKTVGVCVVRCLKESLNLFNHVKDYGVLFYVGRIVSGDPKGRGDEYLFSIKGNGKK